MTEVYLKAYEALIERYLLDQEKSVKYYEDKKIGFDSLLKLREENTKNLIKLLQEM